MLNLDNKNSCCGCGSCSIICKFGAIRMEKDSEGFLYPVMDKEKCRNCGMCSKICPIQSFSENNNDALAAYIVQNKCEEIRRESTSGGAFTSIAEQIIRKKGIVLGAAFCGEHNVCHMPAETSDSLKKFRNSKYVQSDMTSAINIVEKELANGRYVLFSGTPCQVQAIRNQFPLEENLLLVDVMCREVISPVLLEKYIEAQEEQMKSPVSSLRFRDKYYGYHYGVMNIEFKNARHYRKGIHYDQYLRAFFSDSFARPSCYTCPFRESNRPGDITIWDAWDIAMYRELKQDDGGATNVMINTEKGASYFKKCLVDFYHVEVRISDIFQKDQKQKYELRPKRTLDRLAFFRDASTMNGKKLYDKYFPITQYIRIRSWIKSYVYKAGIYQYIHKILLRKK